MDNNDDTFLDSQTGKPLMSHLFTLLEFFLGYSIFWVAMLEPWHLFTYSKIIRIIYG